MGTNIQDILAVHATCVSNDFLDKYMADANGDYIKVYLFMLRHRGEHFDERDAADALNLTEGDIQRAIRYWRSKGVLEKKEEVSSDAEKTAGKPVRQVQIKEEKREESENLPGGDVDLLQQDEEFEGILFVARHILPKLPSRSQVETLQYMYSDLGMPSDVIEYLLEYCATTGKTSHRYMQTVAVNWHELGIQTVAGAKAHVKQLEDKALGKEEKKPGTASSEGRKTGKINLVTNMAPMNVDCNAIALEKARNRRNVAQ